MSKMRIEKDSLGEIAVPEKALYGAQTQRAINNFPVSGRPMPEAFIRAVIHIKRAAAEANAELNCIEQSITEAITAVCDNLLSCEDGFMEHFPVDIFQTGSGTSTNMNVNEVIANLANLEGEMTIHPNDHVNFGQSSNDVIPTAIHVCNAIHIKQDVLPALAHLSATLKAKANLLRTICKTGRTHLMDAMPVRFDQTLHAWAAQVEANYKRLSEFRTTIQTLPQGGTAVGTGINTHPDFAAVFNRQLGKAFGLSFSSAENPASLTSGQETAVVLSGLYKATGITLMKIANDLRWMNSGPYAGLGEISLPPLQPGSSIMPGKVNPVIPESVAMVAAQVIGNDTAITVAAQSGNFELNVMLPMIAANLHENATLLTNAMRLLADKCIVDFTVNTDSLARALSVNPVLATALNPVVGYDKAVEIAKQAYAEQRPVIDVAVEQTNLSREKLETLLDPLSLTEPGLKS